MHKNDKEAIAAILLVVGAAALFIATLWVHAIVAGQV